MSLACTLIELMVYCCSSSWYPIVSCQPPAEFWEVQKKKASTPLSFAWSHDIHKLVIVSLWIVELNSFEKRHNRYQSDLLVTRRINETGWAAWLRSDQVRQAAPEFECWTPNRAQWASLRKGRTAPVGVVSHTPTLHSLLSNFKIATQSYPSNPLSSLVSANLLGYRFFLSVSFSLTFVCLPAAFICLAQDTTNL